MRRLLLRFVSLFRGTQAESELSREIASHLAIMQEDFERRGMPPEEAKHAARREYGGVEQARELHREARSFVWVEQTIRDVRYGARNLMRNPGFTLVAVIALALGIGANTAVFSVVNAVLLKPLAYKDSDRLVIVMHGDADPVSVANYFSWRDRSRSFEAMAAAEYWTPNLTGSGVPEHLIGIRMTQNLLPTLGVRPLLGRMFTPGEDQTGAEREVILSYRLWQRRFSGDQATLGKPIDLNGDAYTVVGVMPKEFAFAPFWATRAELWAPLPLAERAQNRGGNSLRVFARLGPGVGLAQARAEIRGITGQLELQFPGSNRDVRVTPLKEKVVGKIEAPLLMLLAAGVFVLLIACANVAHMLLARTSDRQNEIAVRSALGAGRRRVISQFLTENLLLAALGSAAGLLLALAGTKALVWLSPAYIPRVETVGVDARVVLFLIGLTVLTALVFGLAPAMQSVAGNLSGALKEGGRSSSDGIRRNRLRGALVASEFALAFVLLVDAGLMIRSLVALESLDPGFDPRHILSMVVSVAGSKEAGMRESFYRELMERVKALPGVESVGGINHLPLAGDQWHWSFSIEGRPAARPGESPGGVYRVVMPGYFETMRLPLRRGRAILPGDDGRAPRVVIINERAVAAYWPGEDPIGKRITFGGPKADPRRWLTVVGVAADAKQEDWAAQTEPEVYLAALQNRDYMSDPAAHFAYLTLVVRTAGDPAAMANAVKQTVWSFNRNLPISEVLTMERVVRDANAQPRFEMFLLVVFAGVALTLAAVGIYGVMSYSIARRTREIGIRISLGASRTGVLRMLLTQGMVLAVSGTVAGVAGSVVLSRLMKGMLYSVRPSDPMTFGAVALVLGCAALLATCVPARRATRIEPMTALRHE